MQVKNAILYGVVVLLMTGLAPSSSHAENPASVSLGHLWLTMREACRGVPDTNLRAHGVDRVDFHHDNPETRARVMERTEFCNTRKDETKTKQAEASDDAQAVLSGYKQRRDPSDVVEQVLN